MITQRIGRLTCGDNARLVNMWFTSWVNNGVDGGGGREYIDCVIHPQGA